MDRYLQIGSPLHQAVIQDDLEAVTAFTGDPQLLLAHDPLGFTALELALLLNKKKIVKLLAPRRKVVRTNTLLHHDKALQPLTERQFSQALEIEYLSVPTFENYQQLKNVVSLCPWHLRGVLGKECRDRADDYRKEIWSGKIAGISVRWIDSIFGYGLYADEEIPAGSFIGCYGGRVRRLKHKEQQSHTYCFQYPTKFFSFGYYVIDSEEGGNAMRYANHSDIPNMTPMILCDRKLQHIAFFTNQPITKGMQLTFDYGGDYWKKRSRSPL